MASLAAELSRFVATQLRAAADPAKAGPSQAYMKTDMPFYGVQKPAQTPIFREMNRRFPPQSRREYEAGVRALWRLQHREEKYAAIEFAYRHKQFITAASLPLYEKLVRQGAWWDLVDPIAVSLAGQTLLNERDAVRAVVEGWIDDPDLWIRRTALLVHNHHKQATDQRQLFHHCL